MPIETDTLEYDAAPLQEIVGGMARRAVPKRLAEARRVGHRSRLIGEARLSEENADHWLAAWEAEGRRRGLDEGTPDFWNAGVLGLRSGLRSSCDRRRAL